MEDKNTPHGQEGDESEIAKFKQYWNKCMELERCDSIELNPLIRQQIQQNDSFRDAEESLLLPRQKLPNQSTLSHYEHLLQTKKTKVEEYEHKIQVLENQKAELLKINKQWDQHFKYMKQMYENKVKEEFNLELHKAKEENCSLKKQNNFLRETNDHYEGEIKRLNKGLLNATTKNMFDSINTRFNRSSQVITYEDLKTKNEVLMQQVKIYEEDFNKERADKEKLRKENKELRQIIQQLKKKLHINHKPDYQWYVPGQLPPDVKQKDTGKKAAAFCRRFNLMLFDKPF
ncbi:TNFAIP3-interacting protein 3 [Phyllobates terribilis]|uniref:TNFAIP3-interacting protein 3 n=1 Tax=Phyllobates terribilis TaxID=111132 RepID=UPI003CCAB417